MADEWELYNLTTDGMEMTNLVVTNAPFPTPIPDLPAPYTPASITQTAKQLQALLQKLEAVQLSNGEKVKPA